MTVDVVCAGAPFLDLVFRGLDRMPQAGEEVLARELVVVPGAMANVAFALRQLGLEAVVCAPVGTDPAGRFLEQLMADAGIPWLGDPTGGTSVSVGLPLDGERAFVTVDPSTAVDVAAVLRLRPRAVVANLPLPDGLEDAGPTGPSLYGVVGDPQVAVLRARPADSWTSLRAVFVNEREAVHLADLTDAADAARRLAERGCPVVVTRGARGALVAAPDGALAEAQGVPVVALDTVGAGDLFAAAYIWADLGGRSVDERLVVATTYASRSLAAPGARQKGLTRAAFLDAAGAILDAAGMTPQVSPLQEVRG
jgi:sugar/nucleoside kinase (ribokinase family)